MIAEILDRRFVLEQMRRVREDLVGTPGDRRLRDQAPVEHAEALADLLGDSIEREQAAEAEGIDRVQEQTRLRGADVTLVGALPEHLAYLPRDPLVSALQSALDEYFETIEPERVQVAGGGGRRVRGERTPDAEPVTARRLLRPEPLGASVRLFERFSLTDPRWVQSKLSEWFSRWNGKHGFRDAERPPTTRIADDARIVLVGDWASGLERARQVADHMRCAVEESVRRGQEVHVVHLGDTYYSGWHREYVKRFLPMWPVWRGEQRKVGSWALNGNHDMYSGGYGYYELLEEPRFAAHAGLSFFHLRNEHWDVLGLDTAYEDHRLAGGQAHWVETVVGESQRKSLLLSHHQPFSGRNDGGGPLREQLAGVLAPGGVGVDAWFWGHEHRHAEYDEAHGIRHGRLVGHGGVPVWMWRDDASPIVAPERWEYRDVRHFGVSPFPWAMLGFAILDFAGPTIGVSYVNELGDPYTPPEQQAIA